MRLPVENRKGRQEEALEQPARSSTSTEMKRWALKKSGGGERKVSPSDRRWKRMLQYGWTCLAPKLDSLGGSPPALAAHGWYIAVCWTRHSASFSDLFINIHKSWLTLASQGPYITYPIFQRGKTRLKDSKEVVKVRGQVEVWDLKPRVHGLYHQLH